MGPELNLHHGDCLEVLPSLPSDSVDMVFADLPYGVTANKWDVCVDLGALWNELLRIGKKACAYVFTATQPFATVLINSQSKLFRYDLVWEKNQPAGFVNANKMPLKSHESVFVFYSAQPIYNAQKVPGKPYVKKDSGKAWSDNYGLQMPLGIRQYDGARHPTSVLYIPLDARKNMLHPTQKPVALLEWLIKTYTNKGDTVLDPTMGSGTTGVACKNTGRNFIGIEKELKYFECAKERIHGAL